MRDLTNIERQQLAECRKQTELLRSLTPRKSGMSNISTAATLLALVGIQKTAEEIAELKIEIATRESLVALIGKESWLQTKKTQLIVSRCGRTDWRLYNVCRMNWIVYGVNDGSLDALDMEYIDGVFHDHEWADAKEKDWKESNGIFCPLPYDAVFIEDEI